MTMVVVQHGTWPGWPDGVTVELEAGTAAALLTAVRDYEKESGRDLNGDYVALPAGGLRPAAWVTEMQYAFDHRHDAVGSASKIKSQQLYEKYNMDPASNARPSMSTHTLGICIDIADNGFLAWLKAGNAKRYGLVFTLSPPLSTLNDLRHCQYFPGTATVALDVTNLNTITAASTEDIMHLIADPTLPEQPAPVGPYKPTDRHTGGKYRIVNDASGRSAQVFGTQDQIDLLAGYLAWPATTGAYTVPTTTYATAAQNTTWLLGVLASVSPVGASGGPVDLQPILDAIKALDTQADDYQTQLEAILAKGLTISGTATPAK